MKKLYLKSLFNAILSVFICLFFFTVIFIYFTPKKIALCISVTLSLLSGLAIFKHGLEKEKKIFIKNESSKTALKVGTKLCFMKKEAVRNLFYKAFEALNLSPEKKGYNIYLNQSGETCFFIFGFDGLSKTDVVKAFNRLSEKANAVIYCFEAPLPVQEFAKRFKGRIKIQDYLEVYNLLSRANLLVDTSDIDVEFIDQKKAKLSQFLDRKKAVKFLALGGFFMALSLFVPLKLYYLISGSALVIFAVCVMLFVKKQPD
ncbi:MAG: hypothetical protein E7369_00240 [Clostridiales bacterium]|nr:hypothetical protein [Clostridiales bacterium]